MYLLSISAHLSDLKPLQQPYLLRRQAAPSLPTTPGKGAEWVQSVDPRRSHWDLSSLLLSVAGARQTQQLGQNRSLFACRSVVQSF